MRHQEQLARRAEELGFAALWFRDVPLRDPNFGDIGQVFDPWVYLGWIAAQTRTIALATGSIILPVRHPLHTAKAAASVDQLSGGRLVLGVASGDRPVEFPAFGVDFENRGGIFRENLRVIRTVLAEEFPRLESSSGTLLGMADLVPKPVGRLPIMVTGNSRQTLSWIAENADGWIMYPRSLDQQAATVRRWREAVDLAAPGTFKPFAQSFYVDLGDNPNEPPAPIHLGLRGGRKVIFEFLDALRKIGVNHVILNLKYGRRDAGEVLQEIGREILPQLDAQAGASRDGVLAK
jgi:luciferase-type oxidoreductase